MKANSLVAHWTDCRSGSRLNLCHLAWSRPILASVFTFSQSPCLCKLTFRFLSCAQTNFFQMSHSLLQSDGYDFRRFLTTQLAVVGLKGFSVSIWKFFLYVWRQQPLPLLRYSLFLEMKTVSFSELFLLILGWLICFCMSIFCSIYIDWIFLLLIVYCVNFYLYKSTQYGLKHTFVDERVITVFPDFWMEEKSLQWSVDYLKPGYLKHWVIKSVLDGNF